jgi:carboxypeptidase Q
MNRILDRLRIGLMIGLLIPVGCRHADQSMTDAHSSPLVTTQPSIDPTIARIRQEGLQHSQVDQTLDYLCNVIGQRLTASPSQKRASEWTRDQLAQWGLENAHLEPWGPLGRGWSLEEYSLQVKSPYAIILQGYPKAWSPGLDAPIEADVVYVEARNKADLAKYAGKLKAKVVLIGNVRPLEPHFTPDATRLTTDELAKLAAAPAGRSREMLQSSTAPTSKVTSRSTSRPSVLAQNAAYLFASEEFSFVTREGAAAVIDSSRMGDDGTLFVAQATVPVPTSRPSALLASGPTSGPTTRPKPWAMDVPVIPPQVTLATEDFNRLVRMIARGQQIKVLLNLKVKFYPPEEVNTCDTVAEIRGSDLKDQVVMVGGHLDSWHSGTGATDNGVGAACAMEAVRIIRALNLRPRRTIRVALWTGEEQGLYGSTAYVKQHFGSLPEEAGGPSSRPTTQPLLGLTKKPEYEQLSVYFNLDNGTGRIRGIFAQSNPAAVPYFKKWLSPFSDLDATTVSLSNTGSTDHIPFDRIGLPGFQFIQDTIDYGTRTHHSNEDVFDRIQMQDMKQASTIMAALLWDAANMDARFPRK